MNYPDIRHRLHELAEPSGAEVATQRFIIDALAAFEPTHIHVFKNSKNLLAVYDFGPGGETTLIRGDFDAVRVPETLDLPYASHTPGVAHKCGHDGHATILLGLAEQLHLHPLAKGRVLLFFQAAEETGEGARQLLDSSILEQYRPGKVYALHNIPGEPLGCVICKEGSFTCSVISCDIELHGRTAHAAEPLKAVSPYPAAKAITDRLLAMNCYYMSRDDFRLLTLVEFRVGEQAYGVAAGHGVLRFTLRAKDDDLLQQTRAEVERIAEEETRASEGLNHHIAWKEYFAASRNHKDAVENIRKAAQECGLPYVCKEFPFSWGEDFGLLTQHYEGALFGLGSGKEQPPLHHQNFDFPDELVSVGVKIFKTLLEMGE